MNPYDITSTFYETLDPRKSLMEWYHQRQPVYHSMITYRNSTFKVQQNTSNSNISANINITSFFEVRSLLGQLLEVKVSHLSKREKLKSSQSHISSDRYYSFFRTSYFSNFVVNKSRSIRSTTTAPKPKCDTLTIVARRSYIQELFRNPSPQELSNLNHFSTYSSHCRPEMRTFQYFTARFHFEKYFIAELKAIMLKHPHNLKPIAMLILIITRTSPSNTFETRIKLYRQCKIWCWYLDEKTRHNVQRKNKITHFIPFHITFLNTYYTHKNSQQSKNATFTLLLFYPWLTVRYLRRINW